MIANPTPPPGSGAPPAERVLGVLVDGAADPRGSLRKLQHWATEAGAHADTVTGLAKARVKIGEGKWDLVFLVLGDKPIAELSSSIEALRDLPSAPKVVAVTERPSMETVVHAERLGITDVLPMPLRREDVLRVLQGGARDDDTVVPFPVVRTDLPGRFSLVGEHTSMLEIFRLMARAAPTNANVLVIGEPGTGRETIARCIHLNSPVAAGPWVVVNCAAMPEDALEADLFGQERAAANGGLARRIGRFEQAHGGTIFLDDIETLSMAMQARLLRAVQEHEVERVGGGEIIKVDVRIIVSSSHDLRKSITDGTFRGDLYYRLAIVTIRVPRLADRGGDLLLLAAHFAQQFSRANVRKTVTGISRHALATLEAHRWEGNVRELRNVIEHAAIVTQGKTIRVSDLPDDLQAEAHALGGAAPSALPSLAEVEARHIATVLEHTGGVIHTAAEILGIHRNTLARKVKEYRL